MNQHIGMDSDNLHEFAVRLYNSNELEEAHIVARHLHLVDPFNFRSYKILGIVNQAMEKYSWAIGAYQRAILLKPQDTETMFYLGQCYVHLENYPNAKKWLETCVILDPGHKQAMQLLPLVLNKIS